MLEPFFRLFGRLAPEWIRRPDTESPLFHIHFENMSVKTGIRKSFFRFRFRPSGFSLAVDQAPDNYGYDLKRFIRQGGMVQSPGTVALKTFASAVMVSESNHEQSVCSTSMVIVYVLQHCYGEIPGCGNQKFTISRYLQGTLEWPKGTMHDQYLRLLMRSGDSG